MGHLPVFPDLVVQRTESFPQDKRGGFFEGKDLITALAIIGTEIEYPMLAGQPRFALGSQPSCDIAVELRYISGLHAILERRENRIRVTDVSKNGIVFRGRLEKLFDMGAGDSFTIGETTFYALNDEMRLARPVIAEILGPQRFGDIAELLLTAVRGDHVAVLGEPGNDQERLARAIHHASLRRRHHFVKARPGPEGRLDLQFVEHARHGTLWLDLSADEVKEGKPRAKVNLDESFVEQLFAQPANVRAIVSGRSLDVINKSIGLDLVRRAHRVAIPPLRERAGEIVPLLERWFVDRMSPLRFSDLTDENQAALVSYDWPDNLEQLREAADRVVELASHTNDRTASRVLKIPRTTLQRWLDSVGLVLPLVRDPERFR